MTLKSSIHSFTILYFFLHSSEYATIVMLVLIDIMDVLQLVFYLLMFRTKNEKILPCWNSRIDSRGYQVTNTVEMK